MRKGEIEIRGGRSRRERFCCRRHREVVKDFRKEGKGIHDGGGRKKRKKVR